jgi:hypothetical protein
MPKIKKDKMGEQVARRKKMELDKTFLKYKMYRSSVLTYLLAVVFLAISFVFNGKLLTAWVSKVDGTATIDSSPTFVILDVAIRSISVILFFWYTLVSVGNWQELRGYILTWKEMTVILILSLFQTTINGTVFAISLIGISLILMYMYFIQGKIETELEF